LGFLSVPRWRMSATLFFVACANLTHVERRFRGRPLVPTGVIVSGAILTVCLLVLVRTAYIGEDSISIGATAFWWLGIVAIQCAALVRYVLRASHSNKCIDPDTQ
jgi:hypothetical protein